jgi:hypothetical protein
VPRQQAAVSAKAVLAQHCRLRLADLQLQAVHPKALQLQTQALQGVYRLAQAPPQQHALSVFAHGVTSASKAA